MGEVVVLQQEEGVLERVLDWLEGGDGTSGT